MPDYIFKFPPCFSTVHSILDDPGRGKRYVTKLNETSHLLSYSVHALSVPCFLMGSYLGHPCFVTWSKECNSNFRWNCLWNCSPTWQGQCGGHSPARACSNGYIFTSTAVTSQHLSYLPGLFPQPVVYLCGSAYTWSLVHPAGNRNK